jgi:hypothetical protein
LLLPSPAGVITYRETALLASNTSSLLDRRYIGLVVAHEMAHQWFGDLVTMVGRAAACWALGGSRMRWMRWVQSSGLAE